MNEAATRAELERLGVMDLHPGLSELALSLARAADVADTPATLAALAAQLRPVMLSLCKLQPARAGEDRIDDLTAKREARRRGA